MNILTLAIATANFVVYFSEYTICANSVWSTMLTSKLYSNYRMATEETYSTRSFSKATPRMWAHMECCQICVADPGCLALSFYETDDSYICDLLPDNYCTDLTGKMLINHTGSAVWEKSMNKKNETCFEYKIRKNIPIPCESIRPGCKGNYPNCTECIKSCLDCRNRYFYGRFRTCTLWPDGSGEYSMPIVVECDDIWITLVHRKVNSTTGEILGEYRKSFEDMNRLFGIKPTTVIRFLYQDTYGRLFWSRYRASTIEKNGTLTNLTFFADHDILKLAFRPPRTFDFVTVVNDTYGCGSFWLLDPANATYCPSGGRLRMFGTPILQGNQVLNTGLRFGDQIEPSIIFREAGFYAGPP